jgi:hypothetical protein
MNFLVPIDDIEEWKVSVEGMEWKYLGKIARASVE